MFSGIPPQIFSAAASLSAALGMSQPQELKLDHSNSCLRLALWSVSWFDFPGPDSSGTPTTALVGHAKLETMVLGVALALAAETEAADAAEAEEAARERL